MKKYAAEFTGTFAMVFFGTGSAVINEITGGCVTQMGISLAFGLIVFVVIVVFGHVSGSHINPAVTVALAVNDHFAWKQVPAYILSQAMGALVASMVLKMLFPVSVFLGSTIPSGSVLRSFLLEILLAFLLMLAILQVIKSLHGKIWIGAFIIGTVVFLEAYFAGPVSGASMNPARSLGPAVVSNNLSFLWVYVTAPFIGMIMAVIIFRKINKIIK